jgi:hypothetical protein
VTAALLLAAPVIAIASPADGTRPAAGKLEVRLVCSSCPRDAHAHVVLDHGPAVEADLDSPLELENVAPGPHALRAVLVGKDHLSKKGRGTMSLVRFWAGPRPADEVKAGAAERRAWPHTGKPVLTLVLPQGDGKDRPLLDVHVRGATLARRGHKVRIVIDRKEYPLLADEKPLRLKLKPGPHRITVDLLDRRATRVQPFNRTDRTFEIPK